MNTFIVIALILIALLLIACLVLLGNIAHLFGEQADEMRRQSATLETLTRGYMDIVHHTAALTSSMGEMARSSGEAWKATEVLSGAVVVIQRAISTTLAGDTPPPKPVLSSVKTRPPKD